MGQTITTDAPLVTVIRNAEVYEPEYAGKRDILFLADKIAAVDQNIKIDFGSSVPVLEIDGSGLTAIPGLIDSHEHIMGGGGEGGFHTRTPEATLTDLTENGITTVVGCIGTDGVARDMTALLAKAHGLEEEGITTYVYTGSYQVPVHTLTGSLMKDIMMLDKVIGVGEIAISDHRSSQASFEEFVRIAADSRVGGMLSGKAGIVNVHLGDSPKKLELIERVVYETEIPFTQFLPTHINRNAELFDAGIAFAKAGGYIDMTASEEAYEDNPDDKNVHVCKGVSKLLDAGVSPERFTLSSDAQGSMPVFDENGVFQGIGIGKASGLLKEVRECVQLEGIPLELAIRMVTANPAAALKLNHKGYLKSGYDADLCLLDSSTLALHTVFAKGCMMVQNGKAVRFGTFERK